MTVQLPTAGFVIVDDSAIWGAGPTEAEAWTDFEAEVASAGVRILDDDVDTSDLDGSWSRRSLFKAMPATAALLTELEARGGAIAWFKAGDAACTRAEYEGE